MRRFLTFTCMTLLLTACPESPGPDGPSAGGPEAGGGGPGGPAPNGSGAGTGEGRPDHAHFEVKEGEGVTLSGSIAYDGDSEGAVRLDFLVQDEGTAPRLVHAESLSSTGPWSIEVPQDYGELHIVGFLDPDADGPSPTDPAASITITVGSEPLTDLELTLIDDPDLGSLTPGTPPAAGGEPPKDATEDEAPDGAEDEGTVDEGEAPPDE